MKINFFVIFSLLLMSSFARGVDTDIRVLGLITGGASYGKARYELNQLKNFWENYGGITLSIVNSGNPEVLTNTVLTGSVETQLSSAEHSTQFNYLREAWKADVVLIFTGEFSDGKCGRARQKHWVKQPNGTLPLFLPTGPSQLDLRGKDDSHYAIIALNSSNNCSSYSELTRHETGHLFGGGHTTSAEPVGTYLFNDSHAFANAIDYGNNLIIGARTPISEPNPPACYINGKNECSISSQYSVGVTTNNHGTVTTTAKSVANYRTGVGSGAPGDPVTCLPQPPLSLVGTLTNSCAYTNETSYDLAWSGGACQVNTGHYEIWYSQPDGAPYVKGWTTITESTPAWVKGDNSRLKVRACTPGFPTSCSALSNSSFVATHQCQ